jgi:hypothetical protein
MDRACETKTKTNLETLKSKFHLLLMIKKKTNMNVSILEEIETHKVQKKLLRSIRGFSKNNNR